MKLEIIEGIRTLQLDMISTVTLACLVLMLGIFLRKKVVFFEKFCFPTPVVGGFSFALLTLLLHQLQLLHIEFDTSLQPIFMLAFFTTVGLGGSMSLLKKGGIALLIYLGICWSLAIIQNGVGVGMTKLVGVDPLLGVLAGAVSLEGGHGAAAVFGPEIESLGVSGAAAVAIASATFGLIAGSLLGGPTANYLIRKNKLKPQTDNQYKIDINTDSNEEVNTYHIIFNFMLIGIIMVVGQLIVDYFMSFKIENLFLPAYIGAMFVAIVFRNINDKVKVIKFNNKVIDLIGDVSIGLFLSMAMMSLKIWDLASLALPLLLILIVQVVVILFIAVFIAFPLLGKDYDAAIMTAGFLGAGLGATPNAVANMSAVSEKYQVRSAKAFLIVPLCGAVLIDLVGIPCIIIFINIFS